jgi:glycogen operon protein
MPGRLEPGSPAPLGAHADAHGVNFALCSRNAERVELCLFDAAGQRERERLGLPERSGDVWHGYLRGASPGLVYGYRVYGPYAPGQGHRFNPHKLLLDPYAHALVGRFRWHDAVFGYEVGHADGTRSFDRRDSAPYVPKCRVCAPPASAVRTDAPRKPWLDTILLELHVRGFTRRHPGVGDSLRGTFEALGEPAVIAHLQRLGITAVELLPVACFIDEIELVRRGLVNYWGYNPLHFFVPHAAWFADPSGARAAATVERLHGAGIEVVLDVVFNHTAEGDERGPTLSFRGIDNALYYRLHPDDPSRYADFSGCGNTLDASRPEVVALIVGALRHWVERLGVDGFRLDLAAALCRDAGGRFTEDAPLWRAIRADSLLSTRRWIAEPWDLGQPGHYLTSFPDGVAEWNDRFREGVRRYWAGVPGSRAELATRLAGSSDLFDARGRRPSASVDYVTSHDGFTLADLVAYRRRHNEANGEENRDGPPEALTLAIGPEGPSPDPAVRRARRTTMRSLLATTLLARGVPMLMAGDELSRTQRGNNNAYCHDSELTWLDWSALGDRERDLCDWVGGLAALRARLGAWRSDRYLEPASAARPADVYWLRPDGGVMSASDWDDPTQLALALLFSDVDGSEADAPERLYLALNPGPGRLAFTTPRLAGVDSWLCIADTAVEDALAAVPAVLAGDPLEVAAGALVALVPERGVGLGTDPDIARLALLNGIALDYRDAAGRLMHVRESSLRALLGALGVEVPPPQAPRARAIARLPSGAAAEHVPTWQGTPCWQPPLLAAGARLWGLSVQLPSLRSGGDWGIGDYAALRRLVDTAAELGASALLVSPVHAGSWSRPGRGSPYSPSSRLALEPALLSIDEAIADCGLASFAGFGDLAPELARLRALPAIERETVVALKRRALTALYDAFRDSHLVRQSQLGERFRRFRSEQVATLRPFAVFEALREVEDQRCGGATSWQQWPAELRDARSPAVAQFAVAEARSVERHEFVQWLCRLQWERACESARARLPIGLVTDLAVGSDCDGADTWLWADVLALAAELGAPPDPFAESGQAWGAAPFHPGRLAAADFAPFDALLDAAMRGAGGVRIDHAMALARQFFVPRGLPATRGAYVRFPLQALLARVAAASQRHRCLVICEDLGTVPPGFRDALERAGAFGFRVLWFERESDGTFRGADRYDPLSVATLSTHDLPTLAGFRAGADLDERSARGLFATPQHEVAARRERDRALAELRARLRADGYPAADHLPREAMLRFLAATRSKLVLVSLEDALDERRQVNLPELGDVAPNWRQRVPVAVEDLARDERVREVAAAMRERTVRPAAR